MMDGLRKYAPCIEWWGYSPCDELQSYVPCESWWFFVISKVEFYFNVPHLHLWGPFSPYVLPNTTFQNNDPLHVFNKIYT